MPNNSCLLSNPTTPAPNAPLPILQALARLRFLNIEQLSAINGGQTPGIIAWEQFGLVLRKDFPSLDGKMRVVVALARRGAEALARESGVEVKSIPYLTPSSFTRSLFTLEHALAISELGVVLERLNETELDFALTYWETSPQKLAASVFLSTPKGRVRVPLVADAKFSASYHGEASSFLVEMDRGTIDLKRMKQKLSGYLHWWREGGPEERFGTRNLRLLILVPTKKRRENLRRILADLCAKGGAGFFWLGLHEHVKARAPQDFMTAHWLKPKSDEPLSLFRNRPEARVQTSDRPSSSPLP